MARHLTHRVDTFVLRGTREDRFDSSFGIDDSLTVGDLDGDGADEIIIAEDTSGIIDIYQFAGVRIQSWHSSYRIGDLIAAGDVNGDGIDEIVVAKISGGDVDVYDLNGSLVSNFDPGFTIGDGLAVGDLDGNGTNEIVIAVEWRSTRHQRHGAGDQPGRRGLANNGRSVSFMIECVVPVAVNIKPGSLPTPINLSSKGNIPLAVLTTRAGEYGLPLDFAATTIDPLSVRFGPRALVFPELGGAPESHDRAHPEDSVEKDEHTHDGDMDMVLHFDMQETALMAGATESCIKGQFLSGGQRFKFFGCDSIVTRP